MGHVTVMLTVKIDYIIQEYDVVVLFQEQGC